ncbi:MAG: hypothetical protein COB26_08940 [Piscirickettsiaceae bacterium]|nr:MAG: hypothetical protein COB89_02990 [Piscirickettsiaceae bacterium]PCI68089.1 MAG: hypothetical protein COB26_08940 [Piscirickettsiaceae bacterium]
MNDKSQAADNNDDVFARFSALIDSNIPEEYKQLLKSFQQQGAFYTQLIQSIASNKELTSFWDIPSTLGFAKPSDKQNSLFSSFFDINGCSQQSKQGLENQFSSFLNDFSTDTQTELQSFQTALQQMSEFHIQISQLALTKFNALNEHNADAPDEVLCQHWLSAGESAFSNISQQPDYIETQRQLFESMGKLQATREQLTEHYTSLLGLPSSHEINTLTKALHALRLEFAEYREQTDAQWDTLKKQPKQPR